MVVGLGLLFRRQDRLHSPRHPDPLQLLPRHVLPLLRPALQLDRLPPSKSCPRMLPPRLLWPLLLLLPLKRLARGLRALLYVLLLERLLFQKLQPAWC